MLKVLTNNRVSLPFGPAIDAMPLHGSGNWQAMLCIEQSAIANSVSIHRLDYPALGAPVLLFPVPVWSTAGFHHTSRSKLLASPCASGNSRQSYLAEYLILLMILTGPIVTEQVSLFQYLEPFGTLFFLDGSVAMFSILIGFIVASFMVPRFYCRYACPRGAALGVVSLVSL